MTALRVTGPLDGPAVSVIYDVKTDSGQPRRRRRNVLAQLEVSPVPVPASRYCTLYKGGNGAQVSKRLAFPPCPSWVWRDMARTSSPES